MKILSDSEVFQCPTQPTKKQQLAEVMLKKAEEKLQKIIIRIILNKPFFAVLILRQQLMADSTVITCISDGKTIRYNPGWINKLKEYFVEYTLMSEVMHCVLHHNTRRGSRDKETWDMATDYCVNQLLKDCDYMLPYKAPYDEDYAGLTAEQVYARIYVAEEDPLPDCESNTNDGDHNGITKYTGLGGYGDVDDLPAGSTSEIAQEEAEQNIATLQATHSAKQQGKLPGVLQELIQELLEPKVNWKDELREFITSATGRGEQTWNRLNRRFIGSGEYLPGYQTDELPPFVAVFDTSGSISEVELKQMVSELNEILSDFPDSKATCIYCDAKISDVIEYSEDQPFGSVRPMIGRGGTSFKPPFEWVENNMLANGIVPAALIYMTDLCGEFPLIPPDYQVLWACTCKKYNTPPFGRVVVIEQ
jgi:predicted metal-dependent peptidase